MSILLKNIVIALVFILAGTLFFHNFTSINADIGRHIKLGEIIWQTGEVSKTNLLSFTAPDYPFINHHWLSEAIFYGVFSFGQLIHIPTLNVGYPQDGLRILIIFKIIVLLVTYFLLFFTVRKRNIFAITLAFLVSIFVFSARTEPRPEIFSYLIFAAYLFVIYKIKEPQNYKLKILNSKFQFSWLWLLPILQIFWVNLHIYFIIGPIVFSLFLIEKVVLKKLTRQDLLIGLLVVFANFTNPNFIAGAIYPLKVLGSYGYSVAENSSLFFLANYFGRWAPQDKLFLIALFIAAGSFVVGLWKTGRRQLTTLNVVTYNDIQCSNIKTRIFDLLLIAMTAALSFKMQRNIPLFALALLPVMAKNISEIFNNQ